MQNFGGTFVRDLENRKINDNPINRNSLSSSENDIDLSDIESNEINRRNIGMDMNQFGSSYDRFNPINPINPSSTPNTQRQIDPSKRYVFKKPRLNIRPNLFDQANESQNETDDDNSETSSSEKSSTESQSNASSDNSFNDSYDPNATYGQDDRDHMRILDWRRNQSNQRQKRLENQRLNRFNMDDVRDFNSPNDRTQSSQVSQNETTYNHDPVPQYSNNQSIPSNGYITNRQVMEQMSTNIEQSMMNIKDSSVRIKMFRDQAMQLSNETSKKLIDHLSKIPSTYSKDKKIVVQIMNLYRKYISDLINHIASQIREKDRDIKQLKMIIQDILEKTSEFLQEMKLLHDSSDKELHQLVYMMKQILQDVRMDNYIIEQYKMLNIEKQVILKDTVRVKESSQMVVTFFVQWIKHYKDLFDKISEYVKIDKMGQQFMYEIRPHIHNFQTAKTLHQAVKSSNSIKGICFTYMEQVGKQFKQDFQTFITVNFAKSLYVVSMHTLMSSGLVVRNIERSLDYKIYKTNGSYIYNHHEYESWKKYVDFLKNEEIFDLWMLEIDFLKEQYLF